MVINENVILLMAVVILALFVVAQWPKLITLLRGTQKGEAAETPEPVKTVAIYQPQATTKRKAGRPKKAEQAAAVATPKRLVGRPKKATKAPAKAKAKRPVGRPKKAVKATAAKAKRPVGRPRKNAV